MFSLENKTPIRVLLNQHERKLTQQLLDHGNHQCGSGLQSARMEK